MAGSSPRKLRRGHANLLGGRAWRYKMSPLTFAETSDFDLEQIVISGLLPPHFLSMELKAYQAYRNPELDIHYWRTSTGYEVDFILGDMNVAIEVKGSQRVNSSHIRAMRALMEEHTIEHAVIVSQDKEPRKLDSNIQVLPWQIFLEKIWSGQFGL